MIVMPVRLAVPVLCSVSVCAVLVVLTAQLPNESGPPVTLAVDGVVPVPDSDTGEPVTRALPGIVAVPVAAPVVVGENTMLMVQVLAAASVAVQVPPATPAGRENGAVTATVTPVRLAVPVLCSVSVCAVLVVPTAQLPNASGPPVTLAFELATAISTAPMSKVPSLVPSGRGLPKKSSGGCVTDTGIALTAGE